MERRTLGWYCAVVVAQSSDTAATANPFAVDPEDDLPVGLQLTLRLRALISTGRLAAGERLPSVRRLADWAGVNTNTVRAVYAGLEDEGLGTGRDIHFICKQTSDLLPALYPRSTRSRRTSWPPACSWRGC